LVTNQSGQAVWRWDQQEPFGINPADENPSGLGAFDLPLRLPGKYPSGLGVFDLPLRLPGQYFDKETNLYYNMFRDYWPEGGRYIQSDPIGLEGGPHTYLYAFDPLTQIDPMGLMGRGPSGTTKAGPPRTPKKCPDRDEMCHGRRSTRSSFPR